MDMTRGRSAKRNADRPISNMRPVTSSLRPMTSTGLAAPKTSRGKTGLQRQVQDKSYWVGVLKAKINELSAEIAAITRENEEMTEEESRLTLLKKKAESLARDLASGNLELTIHNEFMDRQRVGDSVEDVKEDVKAIKEDNEELAKLLDDGFEEQKSLEAVINSHERRLSKWRSSWNQMMTNLNGQQRAEVEEIESDAADLNRSMKILESEIGKQSEKRQQLEAAITSGSDSFLKKEMIHAVERLRTLEKQRDDLSDSSADGDEKGRLLAQIKRDNKEVASMEARVAEINSQMEQLKTELEAYEDTETIEKYRDLKKKDQAMDSFLREFQQTKPDEENTIREMGATINETLDRMSRMIAHIDGLKATSGPSKGSSGSGLDRLMDEKRRLELDLSKIAHLEVKIQSELESLQDKIHKAQANLEKYTDIGGLQEDIKRKSEMLELERDQLKERSAELKRSVDTQNEKLSTLRQNLDKNSSYRKAKKVEAELTSILSTNERIRQAISEIDDSFIKKRVLDEARKYNQKLQGF